MSRFGYLERVQKLHKTFVLRRREEVLARNIAAMLPEGLRTGLDVGCGDGIIAAWVARRHPGLEIQGVEVHERSACEISLALFDGRTLPFPDAKFDYVSLVDVFHHTDDIAGLLRECARASKRYVVIKDHTWSHRLDHAVLRFMDWVGNRPYGVRLIYNYWQKNQWLETFRQSGLEIVAWNENLGLYPFPFDLLFERNKHFLVLLSKTQSLRELSSASRA